MSRLKTTTWRKRYFNKLLEAKEEAKNLGIINPHIIDIGPGGAVEFLLNLLPEGQQYTLYEKIKRSVIKPLESGLRRTGYFRLATSEPHEVYEAFRELNPQKLSIIDIESAVIDAAKRSFEGNGCSIPVEYLVLDVANNNIPYQGDIVVTYNVIQRATCFNRALDNIMASVRYSFIEIVCGIK